LRLVDSGCSRIGTQLSGFGCPEVPSEVAMYAIVW